MEHNEDLFDKIDNYLKGKLSAAEMESFKSAITADKELSEMVELHRFEQDAMEELVAENLKLKINDWRKNPPISRDSNKNNRKLKFGLGFVILIFLTLMVLYFSTKKNIPSSIPTQELPEKNVVPLQPKVEEKEEQKLEEHKKPPNYAEKKLPINEKKPRSNPIQTDNEAYQLLAINSYEKTDSKFSDPSQLRGDIETSSNNTLASGIEAFRNKKKIEIAINEFQKIKKETNPEEYQLAQEYIAHAYFQMKEYEKSTLLFQSLLEQSAGSTTAIDEAEWFLTLSLLPEYKKHKTRVDELINKMADPENYHNYVENAIILKAQLEKTK